MVGVIAFSTGNDVDNGIVAILEVEITLKHGQQQSARPVSVVELLYVTF